MNAYVELHCHSNVSFLDGASHPWELARRAADLEMPALTLTDTGGIYGAVRFMQSCQVFGVRPLLGAALEVDGEEIVLLAKTLSGWSNLCRLCSLAHRDQPKGEARTTLAAAAQHRGDPFRVVARFDKDDIDVEVAEELFKAVEGFAAFGFRRSNAAAFARTSYETVWLRFNCLAEYYCGLLNKQPMGAYHPSVLVEDAKRHGVTPLPADVNASAERCLPAERVDSTRAG